MTKFKQEFSVGNNKYTLTLVDSSFKNTPIDDQLAKLYNNSFQADIWGGMVSRLLMFTEGIGHQPSGINVLVIDQKKSKPVFLSTWVWNPLTNAIEMFNTCKDYTDRTLSTYDILNYVHQFIIPEMVSRYGRRKKGRRQIVYRLAVLQKNPCLIAALHTYSRLGFRVEKSPAPMKISLSPYFTMVTELSPDQVVPQKLANNLIRVAILSNYTSQDLLNLIEAVSDRSATIDFLKYQPSDITPKQTWKILKKLLIK